MRNAKLGNHLKKCFVLQSQDSSVLEFLAFSALQTKMNSVLVVDPQDLCRNFKLIVLTTLASKRFEPPLIFLGRGCLARSSRLQYVPNNNIIAVSQ